MQPLMCIHQASGCQPVDGHSEKRISDYYHNVKHSTSNYTRTTGLSGNLVKYNNGNQVQ